MTSVFLAYSSKDNRFVRNLARKLENKGVKTWVAEDKLRLGVRLLDILSRAINQTDFVIAILSPSSIKSKWVQEELQIAMDREIKQQKVTVLPILRGKITQEDIPTFLRYKFYADFTTPRLFKKNFQLLLKTLGICNEENLKPRSTLTNLLNTALMEAVQVGRFKEVQELLNNGADVNAKDDKRRTALMWAADRGYLEIVEELLSKGADVNEKDHRNRTALLVTTWWGHTKIVEMLLEKGADVNAMADDGRTPLICAARKGHEEIVQDLINKGADVNQKTSNGTALGWAERKCYFAIQQILKRAGAKE